MTMTKEFSHRECSLPYSSGTLQGSGLESQIKTADEGNVKLEPRVAKIEAILEVAGCWVVV